MRWGTPSFYAWRAGPARRPLEQGMALYDPSSTAPMPSSMARDPGVVCCILCGLGPVVAGLSGPGPDEQPRGADPGPGAIAPALAWPMPLVLGLPCSISSAGKGPCQEQAEAAMTLSTEQGFPHLVSDRERYCEAGRWPTQGQGAEGMAQMHAGPGRSGELQGQSWDGRIFLPCWPRRMEEWGRSEEGLARCWPRRWLWSDNRLGSATGRRSCIGSRESCCWQQAAPARAATAEAEACFQQALDVARRQQAKSWELRAAMSLAACGSSQGKRAAGPPTAGTRLRLVHRGL